MKTFENQTYYEILKIPIGADLSAIERAYREALDTYSEDALATYSLFTEEQRTQLLQTIESAFHTLIDTDKRTAYDQMLLDSGKIDESYQPPADSNASSAPGRSPNQSIAPTPPKDLHSRVKAKFEEEDIRRLADQVVGKDLVSGLDLRRMREALEVDLSEIFEITRISKTTLICIEENQFDKLPAEVFLKSFLKSYAEILKLDPQHVIEGYLKYRTLSNQ